MVIDNSENLLPNMCHVSLLKKSTAFHAGIIPDVRLAELHYYHAFELISVYIFQTY